MDDKYLVYIDIFIDNLLKDVSDNSLKQIVDEVINLFGETFFLNTFIVVALDNLGKKWSTKSISLSELYFTSLKCEKIFKSFLLINKSVVSKNLENQNIGVITYKDNHFLGKQLLKFCLNSNAYNFYEFEDHLDDDQIIEKIFELDLKYIFVSVLMYDSANMLGNLIKKVKGIKEDTIFIVGGAPFRLDKSLYLSIGADYTEDTVQKSISILSKLDGGNIIS